MEGTHGRVSPEIQSAIRTLALDRMTAQVVTALNQEGIRAILLKGPAIARWLYVDEEWRGYNDCDLLVSDDDVPRAEAILVGIGFARGGLDTIAGDWPKYSSNWIGPRASNIDLHHTLLGVGVSPSELWGVLSEQTERMPVGGTEVEVLRPGARALALVLHVAKDGSRVSKARHDLGHAVRRLSNDVWNDAIRVAKQLDALDAFAAGLRVEPSGAALADALNLPSNAPPPDIAIRIHGGAPPLAAGLDWLVTTPGIRHKTRLVLRKLFPPPAYLRAWAPIARQGLPGLVSAYAWRPIWMLLHMPAAIRSVRRVRTENQRTGEPTAGEDP